MTDAAASAAAIIAQLTRTGRLSVRFWQHRSDTRPVLLHCAMYTGSEALNKNYKTENSVRSAMSAASSLSRPSRQTGGINLMTSTVPASIPAPSGTHPRKMIEMEIWCTWRVEIILRFRADSRFAPRFAPSQWETLLQSNGVSHWLGVNLESALRFYAKLACVMVVSAWYIMSTRPPVDICFPTRWI